MGNVIIKKIKQVITWRSSSLRWIIRRLPWLPVLVIGTFIIVALLAPLLTDFDPYTPDLPHRLEAPNSTYVLGTDSMGRDMLTRMFFGARATLTVVAITLVVGAGAGLVLGLVAGYMGGIVDTIISRIIDTLMAIPTLFLGLLFAATLGVGVTSVVLAISMGIWARFARVIRGDVLMIKNSDFVAQARINGSSTARIIAIHIFPNILNSFAVLIGINLGSIILTEASLSYLGAGIAAPTPSWGLIISEGQNYISSAWWISIIPGVAITLAVLAFNLFGDWLRDWLDPKLKNEI